MDHSIETEAAATASAGGFLTWRRKHALPPGTGCYNCGTVLLGPWCHACGQLGEDFHRSAHHLIWEACEGLFHADGRLWRTVPRLMVDPARLTRDYLAGKRASQVPPLRLFLVVLLVVFVAGEIFAGAGRVAIVQVHLRPGDMPTLETVDAPKIEALQVHIYAPWDAALTKWTRDHLARALAHPDQLVTAMGAWAHDFAFLALPISALMLSLIFAWRGGFVVFDHLVFAMHSLAFQGLLFVACIGLQSLIGNTAWALLLLSPMHLFTHMRGVYRTGTAGTVVRMTALFIASSLGFGLMMLGLVVVGLASLGG